MDGLAFAIPPGRLIKADEYEPLTEAIIGCALKVHEHFGPGLLELVYRRCLVIELRKAGLAVDVGRRVPIAYEGIDLDCVYEPDLVVDDLVVVELKAVEALAQVHRTQLITYLKLTGCPVGLLMNFNVSYLKEGIRRMLRPDLYFKKLTS